MSEGAAAGTERGDGRPPRRRRWIPFWLLQVAELAVALILVDVSVHVGNGGLLMAAAIAFAALAVTAHGPVGLVRICRPWLHITLLVAVAVAVAVAPLVPSLRPDVEGIIVIEFGAIGLIRLATLTDMGPSSRPSWLSRRGDPSVIDATARVTSGTGARPATGGDRTAGSPTGTPTGAPNGAAARRAGRAVGAASASGRRAAARHRPAAEEQMRRAVRRAGRFTGRFVSPTQRHHPPGPGRPGD